MQRTYSRKGTNRRGRTSETVAHSSDSEHTGRPHKRQNMDMSPTTDISSTPANDTAGRPDRVERLDAPSSAVPRPIDRVVSSKRTQPLPAATPEPKRSRRLRTPTPTIGSPRPNAASPLANADTLPVKAVANSYTSHSSKKVAKDLSSLFSFEPDKLERTPPGNRPMATASVAKRMMRRTGTDSSASSIGASGSARVDTLSRSAPTTPKALAKAQSESVIDLTYGSPRSLPLSPSKSQSLEEVSSPPALPSSRPLASGNVRTYAGQSRSFLVALPTAQLNPLSRHNSQSQSLLDDDDNIFANSQEDDFETRESYTDLRTRWGVDNSEDDPRPVSPVDASPGRLKRKGRRVEVQPTPLPSGMYNDLKSITELRSKGESRRFLDEVGYLFEGLDTNAPLSVRRGSALEIVTKLCDAEFARKAKAADFLGRAWEDLRQSGAGNGDKILDTILVFFAALVSKDTGDLTDLATKSDLVTVLYETLRSLDRTNDPLWLTSCLVSDAELRKAGVSKVEKTLLVGLHRLVRKKSALLENGDAISNRLLVSVTLIAVPPHLHSAHPLSSVLKTLSSELDSISSRVSAYSSGLSLFPSSLSSSSLDSPSLLLIDNCLRLLDSFLLGRWTAEVEEGYENDRLGSQREGGLATALMNLCTACDVISRDDEYLDQFTTAGKCLESTLRVLINLTHYDLPWCQAVLDDPSSLLTIIRLVVMAQRRPVEVVKDSTTEDGSEVANDQEDYSDDAVPSLDRLCLALGLLTNLVQVSHEAKEMTRNTLLDFTCLGKQTCTRTCRCASRRSALECLTLVYLERCKSDDDVDPIVRGHMAVLFGLLMQECPENQRTLLDALPGSCDKRKLSSLVDHAREFTLFYIEFTKKVSASVGSQPQVIEELGSRDDHSVGGGFGAVLRDSQGETVAKNVISFLEGLKNHSA